MNTQSVKKKGKNKIEFVLKDSNSAFANSLRRSVISEVPSMAIDKIIIYDNSSVLYDEILSRRLGLLPLSTDLKTYNLTDECTCKGKGCSKCTVALTLEKVGPAAVYASDIKSKDPKIKPVYENMLIAKLAEGQKIKIDMTARLGKGKEHAKFQPGLASFREGTGGNYHFFVESYNNMTPEELTKEALSQMDDKVTELSKKL